MSARLALRLGLLVAVVAASMSLSGCVFFSNAFWRCVASDLTDPDACHAFSEYLDQDGGDWDGDLVENGSDECNWEKGDREAIGCPDADGDKTPDHRDACPGVNGPLNGCPITGPTGATPPPTPTGLTAVGQGSRIRLNWDDVPASDLAGYEVQRATASGGPYTSITSALVTQSTYDDNAIDPAQTYYYVVIAEDADGDRSAPTAPVSAKGCQPPECTGSGPGGMPRISLASARKTYTATVRGRFARARSFQAENGVLRGRALVFSGRLAAGRGAPKGLRRAAWVARMDLSVPSPPAPATARGIALARFGRANQICMRFTQHMSLSGSRRLLGGSFRVIGATGKARQLAAASRFSGKAGRGGAWTLRASGNAGRRVPQALPRACRGL